MFPDLLHRRLSNQIERLAAPLLGSTVLWVRHDGYSTARAGCLSRSAARFCLPPDVWAT